MSGNLDMALWYLGRGTGVAALLMFTVTMVLGIVNRSGRSMLGVGRFGVTDLHRTASLTGTALLVAHIVTLLFDPYAQLRLVDFVLPFLGSYRPLYLGLGTLALDLVALVVVSSLLRRRLGPRVFRAMHWTTYALWPLAMVHVLGIGTDIGTLWLRGVALVCGVAVAASVVWRLSEGYTERGIARRPRKVAS